MFIVGIAAFIEAGGMISESVDEFEQVEGLPMAQTLGRTILYGTNFG